MTITRYLLWVGLAILWFAALSAAQYPLRKRRLIPLRMILIIVKLLLGIMVAFVIMAVEAPLVYQLGFYIAPLHIVLFADAVGDIIPLPFVIKRIKKCDDSHINTPAPQS